MTIKERYEGVSSWFKENMAAPRSELSFESPFQLLVAVILSAQCTDKRVNMVTPALFKAFPGPVELAAASFEEVFALVKSVSYPNNKARHLIAMAQMLCSEFGGEVPGEVDELMKRPGVGRKTANVVSSIVFGTPVIAVDTHVFRVSRRIGLSRGKDPRAVELDLERHIAPEDRPDTHHWLILHGRYTCTALKPRCGECGIAKWCRYYASQAN